MKQFKKHWRRWILVGIAMDCSVLLFHERLFGAQRFFGSPHVTIRTSQSLDQLDGSPLDADGKANGIFTVAGNLTLAPGARVTCDRRSPDGGPCAVRLAVGGSFEMRPGSAILSGKEGNAGGRVEIGVGGDFTMRGPASRLQGASISASDRETSTGGAIDIYAVGKVTIEPGTSISSDAMADGGEIAITAADTDIHGAISARATAPGGRPGEIAMASSREPAAHRS
jgi:hypothetical protein